MTTALDAMFLEEASETTKIGIADAVHVVGLLAAARDKLADDHPAKSSLNRAAKILEKAIVQTARVALAKKGEE